MHFFAGQDALIRKATTKKSPKKEKAQIIPSITIPAELLTASSHSAETNDSGNSSNSDSDDLWKSEWDFPIFHPKGVLG